jgi:hypothetical protein
MHQNGIKKEKEWAHKRITNDEKKIRQKNT